MVIERISDETVCELKKELNIFGSDFELNFIQGNEKMFQNEDFLLVFRSKEVQCLLIHRKTGENIEVLTTRLIYNLCKDKAIDSDQMESLITIIVYSNYKSLPKKTVGKFEEFIKNPFDV